MKKEGITTANTELKTANGGISEEQIQTWKNKYRHVYEISVQDGDTVYIGYFKRPDMETMSAVNQFSKKDEIKSADILFKNCLLGGDPLLSEDAIIKMEAIGQLSTIFGACTGKLKNL